MKSLKRKFHWQNTKRKERWDERKREMGRVYGSEKNCFSVILLYIVKFVHKNLIIKISNNNY